MLLILSLFACKPEATAPVAAASTGLYELSPVEAAKYRPEIELTGSLTPVASVQLGFMVGGRLEALMVNRGQMVAENQAIARLDSALASAQLAAADAAVKGAQAQLAAGESGLARAKSLHDALGMSDQQFQDASAGVEAGRAGVDQALASARLARANFGFHTLKSPINGVVSSAPDNPGAVVGPGSPLFVIEDLSALMLKATAPETAIWLKEGLEATIVSGSGLRAPAKVARVLPALDPATRRLPVELRMDSPPADVRAHSFARATVRADSDADAYSVPALAVVARPDFVVFALSSGAPDTATPTRVPVTVVHQEGDRALVTGALTPGDRVVVDPPSSLGVE